MPRRWPTRKSKDVLHARPTPCPSHRSSTSVSVSVRLPFSPSRRLWCGHGGRDGRIDAPFAREAHRTSANDVDGRRSRSRKGGGWIYTFPIGGTQGKRRDHGAFKDVSERRNVRMSTCRRSNRFVRIWNAKAMEIGSDHAGHTDQLTGYRMDLDVVHYEAPKREYGKANVQHCNRMEEGKGMECQNRNEKPTTKYQIACDRNKARNTKKQKGDGGRSPLRLNNWNVRRCPGRPLPPQEKTGAPQSLPQRHRMDSPLASDQISQMRRSS